ncbi:MAG TPA: ABC transporter substrate-binding protein [Methylomirabilota bacterium]|nr:ABC transporter substrate-binding protein [Methylomirabilota bacterium]
MTRERRIIGRRAVLRAGGVAAGALLTGGLGTRPGRAQGKGKVRFAYLQLGWAACEIIHKEDLLGKRGWQAEYTVVPGSPGGLVNTFAAGNVDAIDMSFALSAKMFEDGVPMKVTGVATAVLGAIVARKDAGIAGVEGLRGRKVAAVVGSTTFFDIRTLALKGYGLDIQKDTQLITAQAPPDMATMIANRSVDAVVAWQPVSDLIVQRGDGVYLAKQIDLWRRATGRAAGFPVHVCYVVSPSFIEKHPVFPRDLNDAQREAVELWTGNRPRAVEIVAEITKMPKPVVEYAHSQTVQMLHGLSDEQIDTLVAQLRLIKESGFLKSDVWDDPARIRREFFWRG